MRDSILDRLILGVIFATASTLGAALALFGASFIGAGPDATAQVILAFCGSSIALAIAAPSRKRKGDDA